MSEVPLYMPERLTAHADRIRGAPPQRPLHTVSDRTHPPGGVRSFWGPKCGGGHDQSCTTERPSTSLREAC